VLLERLLLAPRGLEGREQLDVALTLCRGFRRAWTMHLAGVSALRPSAASARACGAWSLWLRKGSVSPDARRHGAVEWAELATVAAASGHICGRVLCVCHRDCATCACGRRQPQSALGSGAHCRKRKAHQSSRNSHRVQPGLCAGDVGQLVRLGTAGSASDQYALRGLFEPIHRALACSNPARMRVPLFSGCLSLLPFFIIPMSVPCAMLVPRCQRLGISTSAARAHERRISMACLVVRLTHSRCAQQEEADMEGKKRILALRSRWRWSFRSRSTCPVDVRAP
jgi:hypothetical protein